jgi:hypothetical protein
MALGPILAENIANVRIFFENLTAFTQHFSREEIQKFVNS